MFFIFVTFAFNFQLVPPLRDSISAAFGLDEAQSGLLTSMVVIPGIFLALPTGLIMNRYGFRWLGFLSTLLVAAGSLMTALANDFPTILFGRFLLGVGGTFITVGTPAVIRQWFSHADLGKAMGIYATNVPIAIITAFPTAAIVNQVLDWRSSFYVGTALSAVAAAVFVATMKEGPLRRETTLVRMQDVKNAIKTVEAWKASLVWMFFNTAAIAFLFWAPSLFRSFKGLDIVYGSVLSTVVMYAAVTFVPVFGWASDRTQRRKPFIVAGTILMAVSLVAIAYAIDLTLVFSVTLLGLAASMIPPLVMASAADSLPPEMAGVVFSIMTLCQNLGITLAVPLVGYILQTTQSSYVAFFGMSLFALAGTATAVTMKTR
jgi:MFS family permease